MNGVYKFDSFDNKFCFYPNSIADAKIDFESINLKSNFNFDYGRYLHVAPEPFNDVAQYNLGYCYYYGRGMAVDMKKAYIWFSKAALFGDHQALYKLGDMYLNGYFVPKEEKAAMELYFRCYKLSQDEVEDEYGQEV